MNFNSPSFVEQLLWDARQADVPRGKNRADIDRLFDGHPPATPEEWAAGGKGTNVNFLEAPKLLADARRTYYNAFLNPGNFFSVSLDSGTPHKRGNRGAVITNAISKRMKRSLKHFEMMRSQFAMTCLHGIGPTNWADSDSWCPRAIGIEDVLVPSNTLLTMDNLPHFGLFRQYTAMELQKILNKVEAGKLVNPGWNLPLVKAAIKWADDQVSQSQSYNDLLSPQKIEERLKQDLGFYGSDAVPTIDCWDFYFYSDEDKPGWRRRMVLDTPLSKEVYKAGKMSSKNGIGKEHGEWFYNSKNQVYAEELGSIMHWQFGDTSAVAPFRYHSVRSLGWLLYAVCHIQNRLRCKMNDAVFEALLQYFRTSNPDDHERLLKAELSQFGIVPENVQFVKSDERWKVDRELVEGAIAQNRGMMIESAAQFREGRDNAPGQEKTATQIMAEVNSANALIGAMLSQAYMYQNFQHIEIARRFTIKDSRDPDVKKARLEMLKEGVPEELIDAERWNVQTERVMGSGNKTLEIAIADKLMAARNLHDPESQREILHIYDLANTSNPDLATRLVPLSKPRISDSVHDAELATGTLMQGLPVTMKTGMNHTEYVDTMLRNMAVIIKGIEERGGMATEAEIKGLRNLEQHVQQHIEIIAQDKEEGQRVKIYGDDLGKLMNLVKAYEQRLDEAKKKQQEQGGGDGGEAAAAQAKVQATVMGAQTKAKIAEMTAAQKLKHKQDTHQQRLAMDQQKHEAQLAKTLRDTEVGAAALDIKTAADIRREDSKPNEKPKAE